MNRELKFRVWNGMEMVYDVTIGKFGAFYVNPMSKGNGLDENDSASLTPFNTRYHNDTPVMQFTGLKDKNGKEIYEGDIVDVAYAQRDDDGYVVSDPPARGFVDWDEHSTGWIVRTQSKMSVTPDGTVMTSIITKEPGYVEIIGHKYQTPDLLTRAAGV